MFLYSVANIRPENSTHGSYLAKNENHYGFFFFFFFWMVSVDSLVIVHA